jgi:hypothetical protein
MINTSTVAHQGRWGVHSITALQPWNSKSAKVDHVAFRGRNENCSQTHAGIISQTLLFLRSEAFA